VILRSFIHEYLPDLKLNIVFLYENLIPVIFFQTGVCEKFPSDCYIQCKLVYLYPQAEIISGYQFFGVLYLMCIVVYLVSSWADVIIEFVTWYPILLSISHFLAIFLANVTKWMYNVNYQLSLSYLSSYINLSCVKSHSWSTCTFGNLELVPHVAGGWNSEV
jgi:hypothetical protein